MQSLALVYAIFFGRKRDHPDRGIKVRGNCLKRIKSEWLLGISKLLWVMDGRSGVFFILTFHLGGNFPSLILHELLGYWKAPVCREWLAKYITMHKRSSCKKNLCLCVIAQYTCSSRKCAASISSLRSVVSRSICRVWKVEPCSASGRGRQLWGPYFIILTWKPPFLIAEACLCQATAVC